MTKKKKIFLPILILLLCVALFFGSWYVYYLSTTMSADDVLDYCKSHTETNATEFDCVQDGRYVQFYLYWIAADGDDDIGQEIFVFRKTHAGPFKNYRYKYVCKNSLKNEGEDVSKVGSLEFYTKNDSNEKESKATQLFFGNLQDTYPTYVTYDVTTEKGVQTIEDAEVPIWSDCWLFTNVSWEDNEEYSISNVKFYDSAKNLIGSYE